MSRGSERKVYLSTPSVYYPFSFHCFVGMSVRADPWKRSFCPLTTPILSDLIVLSLCHQIFPGAGAIIPGIPPDIPAFGPNKI